MDFKDIYTELEKNGTEEITKSYVNKGAKGDMFGVSFDVLQKIKSKIVSPNGENGVNHSLAKQLWDTRNIDARMLACMVADSNLMTRHEAYKWILGINFFAVADLFAELIAKTAFGIDVMYFWIQSQEEYVKRIGFLILKYLAENDTKRSDLFFNAFVQKIKQGIQTSPNRAREAMFKCMVAIGSRNEFLRDQILDAARVIGSVVIEEETGTPETYEIDEIVAGIWQKVK